MPGKRSLTVSVYLRPAKDGAPPVEWSTLGDVERERLRDQILLRAAEALLNSRMRMSGNLQKNNDSGGMRLAGD